MGKGSQGTLGFGGEPSEPGKYDQYLRHYVRISVPNQGNFSGFLKRLRDDGTVAVLNPYLFTGYDKKRGAVKKIVEKDRTIDLPFGTTVEFFSRKGIETYCTISNLEEELRMHNLRQSLKIVREQESGKKKKSKKGSRN